MPLRRRHESLAGDLLDEREMPGNEAEVMDLSTGIVGGTSTERLCGDKASRRGRGAERSATIGGRDI